MRISVLPQKAQVSRSETLAAESFCLCLTLLVSFLAACPSLADQNLYSYDPYTKTWTLLSVANSDERPSMRSNHGFTSVGGILFVHGGSGAAGGWDITIVVDAVLFVLLVIIIDNNWSHPCHLPLRHACIHFTSLMEGQTGS